MTEHKPLTKELMFCKQCDLKPCKCEAYDIHKPELSDVRSAAMGIYEVLGRKKTHTLTKAQVEIMYWFPVFFNDDEVSG